MGEPLPDAEWWPLKWKCRPEYKFAEIQLNGSPAVVYDWDDQEYTIMNGGDSIDLQGLLELRCFLLELAKSKSA